MKKLIIVRTATIVEEVPFTPDFYPKDLSLVDAIETEKDGPETGWGETFFDNENLTYNVYVVVIETAEDTEGEKGND